nr:MAG TPA: hypothetical protein [Caudoviricetes sp.]
MTKRRYRIRCISLFFYNNDKCTTKSLFTHSIRTSI